jgi:hypothetical protein
MSERLINNTQPLKKFESEDNHILSSLCLRYMPLVAMFALVVMCVYPEVVLAANNLEQQLDKVGAVANGKFKTIGLTAATIGGGIWSVVKGNLKLAGIIIAIGITLSLYLEWIAGGMVVSA